MPVTGLDHVVVTVSDIDAAVDFYTRLPGIEHVTYGGDGTRHALRFGEQKIDLHEAGDDIEPRASAAEPGDSDLCLLTDDEPGDLVAEVEDVGIPIELGPVERHGAYGTVTSVYVRDPDGSLIEVATYA